MFRLRYAKTSPFVRKVLAFAIEAGLDDKIEIEPVDVWAEASDIFKDNPLGKIPAMQSPDGVFVGSFAICDYLDQNHVGVPLMPRKGADRWRVMQIHGLADGALEASVAYVVETIRRPSEFIWDGYAARQIDKIARAVQELERRVKDLQTVDLGSITTGCLCGYLDFRLKDRCDWRAAAPNLANWHADFSQRASFARTAPV